MYSTAFSVRWQRGTVKKCYSQDRGDRSGSYGPHLPALISTAWPICLHVNTEIHVSYKLINVLYMYTLLN